MNLVQLTLGSHTFYVVPEHVTHIKALSNYTEVYLVSGESIKVDGDVVSVGTKLRGR